MIDFVSANPTGPVHVGNGWCGATATPSAAVMTAAVETITGSTTSTTLEAISGPRREPPRPPSTETPSPRGGYPGQYVADLAAKDDGPRPGPTEAGPVGGRSGPRAHPRHPGVIDIPYDEWLSQASVEESGALADTIELLASQGLCGRGGRRRSGSAPTDHGDPRDRCREVERRPHVPRRDSPTTAASSGPGVRPGDRRLRRRPPGQVPSLAARPSRPWGSTWAPRMQARPDGVLWGEARCPTGRQLVVDLDELVAEFGADATRLLSLHVVARPGRHLDLDKARSETKDNSGLLRAVRPRPHRLDRPGRSRAGRPTRSAGGYRPVPAGARARD